MSDKKEKSFIKNVLTYSISTWVSFAISFFATPIITRLFLPEELGKITMFTTVASLLLVIVPLGTDQAYIRFYNEPPEGRSVKHLIIDCLLISGIGLTIVTIATVLFNSRISMLILGDVEVIIPFLLIIYLCSSIILRYLNITNRMSNSVLQFNIQAILIVIITKVLYVITAFWNPSYKYALICLTFGTTILALIYLVIQRDIIGFKGYKPNKKAMKGLLAFGVPMFPATMLIWLDNSISRFILRMFFDFREIGIYSAGLSIASLIGVIQAGFNTYWGSFVYANYKEKQEEIKSVHKYLTMITILFALGIVLFQDVLFLLLGRQYAESKIFFAFLLVAPICTTIAETTVVGINIEKKTYWHTIIAAFSFAVNIIFSMIFIPIVGISGVAIGSALSGVSTLLFRSIIGNKYYKSINNYNDIFVSIIVLLLMGIINYGFRYYVLIKYILLLILVFIVFVIYRRQIIEIINISIKTIKAIFKKK